MATDNTTVNDRTTKGWMATSIQAWFARNSIALVIVGLLLVCWEFYSRFLNTRGNIYFPSISHVVNQTYKYRDMVIAGFQATLIEALFGFVLAIIFGIGLGILFSKSYLIRQGTLPMLVYFYSLPHAIVAPLFIVWFGNGLIGIGLFVAWFAFFAVFVNTMTGLSQVPPELHRLAEVSGATSWQRMKHVEFWSAMPHIGGGIKIGVQQAIVATIIAEFIATGSGLGYLIVSAGKLLREGMMFGVLIIIMLVSILFYKFISLMLNVATPGPSDASFDTH